MHTQKFHPPEKQSKTPKLPLFKYHFKYVAQQRFPNFVFSTSLWHGVFGNALRQISCVMPNTKCEQCLLMHQCHYSFLFRGTRPANSSFMKKYSHIPVPYCFQDLVEHKQTLEIGEHFSITMVLIGKANQTLPLIIRSMMHLGELGFGQQRYRARLSEVTLERDNGLKQLVFSEGALHTLPENALEAVIPGTPKRVRLQFNSAYQPTNNGMHENRLDIEYFCMKVIRRQSLLQYFYTDTELSAVFKDLKQQVQALAKAINTQTLQQVFDAHYSSSHKHKVKGVGFTGYIDIPIGDYACLWSYFFLGQSINAGKNASMGYGQYELLVLEA